jgi:hypothetical protein
MKLDCFAEPVIGRRFAPTRWLAMTDGTVDAPGNVIYRAPVLRNAGEAFR